jgi:hypothetical protein
MESGSSVQLYVALRMVAIPAAAALAAVVIARLGSARDTVSARVLGVGVGAGAIAAHLGIAGFPPIPPIDTIGWIAPAIAVALVLLLVVERSPGAGVAVLLVVGAATGYLIGKPVWSSMSAAAAWIALVALAVAGAGSGLAFAAERVHPAAVLAAITVALAGSAVACVASHSALLAMVLGGFAVATGAATVGTLVLRVPARGRTLPGVLAVGATAIVLYARLYSALPVPAAALLAAAFLAPAIVAALPRFRGRSIVAIVVAAILAAGAAGLALRAGAAAEAGGDDAYYR